MEDEFDALADRLGFIKKSSKSKSLDKTAKVEKIPNVAKGSQPFESFSDQSDSSSSEEDAGPESPGAWELIPGCSATRPQFVKVRPGQTLDEALEERAQAMNPARPDSPKKRRNSTGQKLGKPVKTGKRGRPAKNPKTKVSKKSDPVISNQETDDSDIEAPPPISQRSKSILLEKARKESSDRSDSESSSDDSQRPAQNLNINFYLGKIVLI